MARPNAGTDAWIAYRMYELWRGGSRRPAELEGTADPLGDCLTMEKLTDQQRRALRLLACHHDGCAEALLLAEGFHVGQLAVLVIDGFVTMQRTVTDSSGQQKNVVWMKITEEGRRAIAE
jgi:hypothetical protein